MIFLRPSQGQSYVYESTFGTLEFDWIEAHARYSNENSYRFWNRTSGYQRYTLISMIVIVFGYCEDDRFENIKDLLNSNDQTVWKRIEEKFEI